MKGRGGKSFERDIGKALGELDCYVYNCNDACPEADFAVRMHGLSYLFELKKTEQAAFPSSLVKPRQRRNLERHWAKGGGHSILIIKQVLDGDRVWWILWQEYLQVLARLAGPEWVEDTYLMADKCRCYTVAQLPKRGPGRKRTSLPLLDGHRPAELRELTKRSRRNRGGKVWDLNRIFTKYRKRTS